jgi:hypothetical protein
MSMFRRKRSGADFFEEIQAHVDLEAEALQAEGLREEEARRLARIKFGSLRREQVRGFQGLEEGRSTDMNEAAAAADASRVVEPALEAADIA